MTAPLPSGGPAPHTTPRHATRGERLVVLGPLALAALFTAASLVLDAGAEHVGPAWLAAVAWTVPASLAMALRRGIRHRDWSAFGRHELADRRDEEADWTTQTGMYAWMQDWEDRIHDNDHLRDHDHG